MARQGHAQRRGNPGADGTAALRRVQLERVERAAPWPLTLAAASRPPWMAPRPTRFGRSVGFSEPREARFSAPRTWTRTPKRARNAQINFDSLLEKRNHLFAKDNFRNTSGKKGTIFLSRIIFDTLLEKETIFWSRKSHTSKTRGPNF